MTTALMSDLTPEEERAERVRRAVLWHEDPWKMPRRALGGGVLVGLLVAIPAAAITGRGFVFALGTFGVVAMVGCLALAVWLVRHW